MWWKELFFTGFFSGYSPIAPGTAGTLLAVLIYILEYIFFKTGCIITNFIFVLIMLYPSFKLGDAGEKFFNKKDPSEVVIDEMIGLWVSVLFIPFSLQIALLAFIIFRIIDIFKPYPIRKLEKLKGGFGIVLDDFMAGVFTNIIIRLIIIFTGFFGVQIV
jgi:phosphatidylglycerophosphatase A